MKSIKGKLYFVYALIALALGATIFSSYIATDTNNQHLMLSELLSQQRLHVEKVVMLTEELAQLRIIDENEFFIRKDRKLSQIEQSYEEVEFVLETFRTRVFNFNGKDQKLKYTGNFEEIFVAAVKEATGNWKYAKEEINGLITDDMVSETYAQQVSDFEMMNHMLISDVDYITKLCRDEAEKQRKIANTLQAVSLLVVGIIFIWLVYFIRKDIQVPMLKIRSVFKRMGSGDFQVSLERKTNDEFKQVFDDFNRFIDNKHTIDHIEDHILEEDNLRTVLVEMLADFRPFVELTHIAVVYTDSFSNYMEMKSNTVLIEPVEDLKYYEEVTCVNNTSLIMPIKVNNVYLGFADFYKADEFSDQDIKFVSGLEKKISFAFYKSLIFKDLLRIVTTGLADLTESRDPETKRHLERMSLYSQIIATKLYDDGEYKELIDGEFLENILLTAPMHDIGKVAVPDYILLKPGKLTEEEFALMREHTCEGARVLKAINQRFSTYNINYFKMAENIAHYHQEKFNGSGYPEGVSGEEIPLAARICAVADVFDALTSKRPYKEAFSLEKSYSIIKESSGSHFDPRLVKAFFDSQTAIEAVYYEFREV